MLISWHNIHFIRNNPLDTEGEGIVIYQEAWFQRAMLEKDKRLEYNLKNTQNSIYLFVISGQVNINNEISLQTRDGVGILDIRKNLTLTANEEADILLMEIPYLDI